MTDHDTAEVQWKSILFTFLMRSTLSPEAVFESVRRMPRESVMVFQLALKGTGHVTDQFVPDGEVGQETARSIRLLYKAAVGPTL